MYGNITWEWYIVVLQLLELKIVISRNISRQLNLNTLIKATMNSFESDPQGFAFLICVWQHDWSVGLKKKEASHVYIQCEMRNCLCFSEVLQSLSHGSLWEWKLTCVSVTMNPLLSELKTVHLDLALVYWSAFMFRSREYPNLLQRNCANYFSKILLQFPQTIKKVKKTNKTCMIETISVKPR